LTLTPKNRLTDEELVRQLLATGNALYFEQLYNRYFSKVYYQTLSYLKESEEARDLTQDIFVKLYDRLAKFQGKSSFSTWLFSFARNSVIDYLRKKGKLKEESLDEAQVESIPEVEDNELLQLRADRLAHVLEEIPPDDKAVLIMMYANEWKMDEIAEVMGLSLSAVKMRLKRAKAKVLLLYQQKYTEA
jgi:RNA polymerase sigma factor (sigma-70 family)